jgi:predicted PurR-regulated permease PerM
MTEAAKTYFVTQTIAAGALIAILMLGLLPALLAGLLVYQLIEFGSKTLLFRIGINPIMGKTLLVVALSVIVMSAIGIGTAAFASYVSDGPESIVVLLQRMADVVDTGRMYLPLWAQQYLPANIEEWQVTASTWLRENARDLSIIGKEAGVFIVHLIIGMIIGGMVALNPGLQNARTQFSMALRDRVIILARSFRRIVFSQIRISALNTFLTAIFLAGVMPLLGMPLPLTKTMIAVTFFAGLLPIVGNLLSNTVIFLIALSVSPMAAVGSLAYLVLIHKLEYFINARIIGSQIRAKAWELLIAMVFMEAAFGIAGLVAAPIFYAYMKDELETRKFI